MERFASFDGVEIAYRETGDGPPVVLLHGFAASHAGNWVHTGVLDALVASGRRVIASDARGHGSSDKPHDASRYDDDAMVRDAAALIDFLGLRAVDVVGYSMGAMTAARLVARDERARSVVLGGIGGDAVPPGAPGRLAKALVASDASEIAHPVGRAFRRFADLTGADREALAAVDRSNSLRSAVDFAAITVPALVLVGDKDTLIGSPQALADRLPDGRLVVLPGDHLSVVGRPEFAAAIVDFLAGVSPAA